MDDRQITGNDIKQIRLLGRYTQEKLARALNVSWSTIHRWEKKEREAIPQKWVEPLRQFLYKSKKTLEAMLDVKVDADTTIIHDWGNQDCWTGPDGSSDCPRGEYE